MKNYFSKGKKMDEEMMFVLEEEMKCWREESIMCKDLKEQHKERKYEVEREKEIQKLRQAHLKMVANSLYGSLSHCPSGGLFFAKGFKSSINNQEEKED